MSIFRFYIKNLVTNRFLKNPGAYICHTINKYGLLDTSSEIPFNKHSNMYLLRILLWVDLKALNLCRIIAIKHNSKKQRLDNLASEFV